MPTKKQFMACPKRSSDPDAGTYWIVLLTPAIACPVRAAARSALVRALQDYAI